MLRSSLGFHTLTLTNPLFFQEAQYLISDFKRYSKETGAIQMYQDHGCLRIEFLSRAKGIGWLIRPDVWIESIKMAVDIVDVTINPKILGGIYDYITAATYDDMKLAICQRQPENVDFRRNGMSFFGGQRSGVYSPYTPLHLPA